MTARTDAPAHPVCRSLPLVPGRWLILAIMGSCLALAVLMAGMRLDIDLRSSTDQWIGLVGLAAAVAFVTLKAPRTAGQAIARDALEFFGFFTVICLIGAVASYPVAAYSHGFSDPAIERVDSALHFNWISWYDVVAAHPALQVVESVAYESIFVTPLLLLGYYAATGRRAEARLFLASFWLAALVTLALFVLAPAEGPLAYLWRGPIPYMPASALYQANLIPLLRHHELHSLTVTSLHGLVCIPSFHAASAVLYIAAAWPIRRLRWPLLAVNGAMLLATPVEGTHYLADIILGVLVALAAMAAVRLSLRGLPAGKARQAEIGHPATAGMLGSGLEAYRSELRRLGDRELLRRYTTERRAGPRASAMAGEIDRRGLVG